MSEKKPLPPQVIDGTHNVDLYTFGKLAYMVAFLHMMGVPPAEMVEPILDKFNITISEQHIFSRVMQSVRCRRYMKEIANRLGDFVPVEGARALTMGMNYLAGVVQGIEPATTGDRVNAAGRLLNWGDTVYQRFNEIRESGTSLPRVRLKKVSGRRNVAQTKAIPESSDKGKE